MWQPIDAVPIRVRIGSAPPLEYFDELINVRTSRKKRKSGGHFREDAPDAPDVNCARVAGGSEEKFRRTIPERDNFKGVGTIGQGREPSETEVCQFEGGPVSTD